MTTCYWDGARSWGSEATPYKKSRPTQFGHMQIWAGKIKPNLALFDQSRALLGQVISTRCVVRFDQMWLFQPSLAGCAQFRFGLMHHWRALSRVGLVSGIPTKCRIVFVHMLPHRFGQIWVCVGRHRPISDSFQDRASFEQIGLMSANFRLVSFKCCELACSASFGQLTAF